MLFCAFGQPGRANAVCTAHASLPDMHADASPTHRILRCFNLRRRDRTRPRIPAFYGPFRDASAPPAGARDSDARDSDVSRFFTLSSSLPDDYASPRASSVSAGNHLSLRAIELTTARFRPRARLPFHTAHVR
jgi:hypothetical protein